MKKIYSNHTVLCFLIAHVVLAGCSKGGGSATTLAPDKVPVAMNVAFAKASGDAKTMAAECVTACQNQDVTAAFTGLQKLSQNRDLTPQQRAVTVKAMAATFQQLRTAADNGNAAAQAIVQKYMATR